MMKDASKPPSANPNRYSQRSVSQRDSDLEVGSIIFPKLVMETKAPLKPYEYSIPTKYNKTLRRDSKTVVHSKKHKKNYT